MKAKSNVAAIVRNYFSEIEAWRSDEANQYSWEEIAAELRRRTFRPMTGHGLRYAFNAFNAFTAKSAATAGSPTPPTAGNNIVSNNSTVSNSVKASPQTLAAQALPQDQVSARPAQKPPERISPHQKALQDALRRGNEISDEDL